MAAHRDGQQQVAVFCESGLCCETISIFANSAVLEAQYICYRNHFLVNRNPGLLDHYALCC